MAKTGKLTIEQANEVLKRALELNEFSGDLDYFNGGDIEEIYDWGEPKQLEDFTIKQEDSFGGEGQGDDYWFVLSITPTDGGEVTHIQFTGWYNSWEGTEWSDGEASLVKPIQVKVTQWAAA